MQCTDKLQIYSFSKNPYSYKFILYNMLLYKNSLIFNVLFSESRISGREAAKEISQRSAIQW